MKTGKYEANGNIVLGLWQLLQLWREYIS